jgi:ankyrin repeat protein
MKESQDGELIEAVKTVKLERLKTYLNEHKHITDAELDKAIRFLLREYSDNEEYYNCVKVLLYEMDNINYQNKTTLLMEACSQGNKPIALLLLSNFSEVVKLNQVEEETGENVLHKLLNSKMMPDDKFDIFKKLVDKNLEIINVENRSGYTPLAYALILGDSKISEELVHQGAPKNHIIHSTGDSMLHCAVYGKNPACLNILHDLDIKYKNKKGETAIDLAIQLKLDHIVKVLQTYGDNPDVNSKLLSMMHPLQEFKNGNYNEALKLLAELKQNNKDQSYLSLDWNMLLTQFNKDNKMLSENYLLSFLDIFKRLKITEKSENYILFLNYGLLYYKLGDYKRTMRILIDNLQKAMNHYEWVMFVNVSFIFLDILLNQKQLSLVNKILQSLEEFLSTTLKMNEKNKEVLKDNICDYLNSREIVNKFSPLDESFCLVNLYKSYKYIQEGKPEEAKKTLKEYKRIFTNCKYKDVMPVFNTLKKFYYYLKIRLDYSNNSFFKCYKHLNSLYNTTVVSKTIQPQISFESQVFYMNSFGIVNMKQKKFYLAEFYFKKCLTFIKDNKNHFEIKDKTNYTSSVRYNLALCYFFQRKYEEALSMFKQVLEYATESVFLYFRIALCNLEIELQTLRNKKASSAYNELIERLIGYSSNLYNNAATGVENPEIKQILLHNNTLTPTLSSNLSEAISYFKKAILLLKDSLICKKEFSDIYNFYSGVGSTNLQYPTESKSYQGLFTTLYINLLFTLLLNQEFTECLTFANEFEGTDYYNREISYIIDNYKIEAYLALNQPQQILEILKKNMLNSTFSYNSLEFKGSFYSGLNNTIYPEINYKLALYINIIKMNFINNNIVEVERGIASIITLLNVNVNHSDLPPYVLNLLVYYYIVKENYEMALTILKYRKVSNLTALNNTTATVTVSKPVK